MRLDLVALAVLAVWRLTHLVAAEDGPWNLSRRLRRAAGDGFWGGLVSCFYCLSLWLAAPFAAWLGTTAGERLLLWPALSGAAILLHRLTEPAPAAEPVYEPVPFHEEPEHVLRTDDDPPATGEPPA